MFSRSKFLLALAGLAFAAPVIAAPVSAPTPPQGKALILIPLTLTKVEDLDFGTVVPRPMSGFVTINADTGARAGSPAAPPACQRCRAIAPCFAGAGTPSQQVIVCITPPAGLTNGAGDTIPVLALTLDDGGNPIRTIAADPRLLRRGRRDRHDQRQPARGRLPGDFTSPPTTNKARRALNGAGRGCYLTVMPPPPPPEVFKVKPVRVACDGSGEVDPPRSATRASTCASTPDSASSNAAIATAASSSRGDPPTARRHDRRRSAPLPLSQPRSRRRAAGSPRGISPAMRRRRALPAV